MAPLFSLHPENPQARVISQVVAIANAGGVLALPTDASYILACAVDAFSAALRIRTIRGLDDNHLFSLVCSDLSAISEYAQMDDAAYRLLKRIFPGGYTAILKGSKQLGKKLSHPKRKTIGVRVPDYLPLNAIIHAIGRPLIATTLILDDNLPNDPEYIREALKNSIEGVVDCGIATTRETTVLDLSTDPYSVIREGFMPTPW